MRGGRRRRYIMNRIQPMKGYVRMKYSTSFTLDPGVGIIASRNFSTNSIYDPDRAIGGHQPYLHDLYETLYGHYEVVRSTIVVRPVMTSSTPSTIASQVAVRVIADPADLIPGFDELRESNRGVIRYMNTNSGVPKMKMTWRRYKALGGNSPQQFGADFGFDPSKQNYFQILFAPVYATEDVVGCQFCVDIYYTCRLTAPITQRAS